MIVVHILLHSNGDCDFHYFFAFVTSKRSNHRNLSATLLDIEALRKLKQTSLVSCLARSISKTAYCNCYDLVDDSDQCLSPYYWSAGCYTGHLEAITPRFVNCPMTNSKSWHRHRELIRSLWLFYSPVGTLTHLNHYVQAWTVWFHLRNLVNVDFSGTD